MMGWFKKLRQEKEERQMHNDRDFDCKFWWGDRSGSTVGVMNEKCEVCK